MSVTANGTWLPLTNGSLECKCTCNLMYVREEHGGEYVFCFTFLRVFNKFNLLFFIHDDSDLNQRQASYNIWHSLAIPLHIFRRLGYFDWVNRFHWQVLATYVHIVISDISNYKYNFTSRSRESLWMNICFGSFAVPDFDLNNFKRSVDSRTSYLW